MSDHREHRGQAAIAAAGLVGHIYDLEQLLSYERTKRYFLLAEEILDWIEERDK